MAPPTEDPIYMSATELLAHYRARRLSPVEVTQAALDRIAALDGRINAFCLVDQDRALAAARDSEGRWMRGAPAGRLDGVPTSVKDLQLTRFWPTLRGSRTIDADQKWDVDAPVVARLRAHGAVLLGKTTTPEFGWKGVTDSALTGVTRNPWNPALTPGGSSGGAAAGLAAGMSTLALGGDAGGSIRIPASMTGVAGIKATYGRVPTYPPSPFGSLSNQGPMARNAADLALMLSVLAEPDGRDADALPYDGCDYSDGIAGGVGGLRIAYSARLGYVPRVDPEIEVTVAEAARRFADLGAVVEPADPDIVDCEPMFITHWKVAAFDSLGGLSAAKAALLEPGLARIVEAGRDVALAEYLAAVSARVTLTQRLQGFFADYDLLLTPTLATPPFPVNQMAPLDGDGEWTSWTPFTFPFNLSRQPAASIACGFTGDGLPIGLQIVGPHYAEQRVLRAAHAFEIAHPLDRRPQL